MGPGLKNKLKIMKFIFEKEVWFSNNNIMIYLFIVLSFSRCHIILHDHKLRTNPSFKEVLILFLFHCFAWRFHSIVIHQNKDLASRKLLKRENVIYREMPPHGLPLKISEEKIWEDNQNIKILCFGRVEHYKNFEYFSELIGELKFVDLIIAGKGNLEIESLPDNVRRIEGYISDETLGRLILDCDYFAMPYLSITQSALPALAGKFSKPLIYSSIDEFSSFDTFKNGIKIDGRNLNKDVSSLKSSLVRNHSEKYKKMSDNSSSFYQTQNEKWDTYMEVFSCD